MPRLLILSTTFYPDPTVAAVRVSQWARWLPEHGWETRVLCRHYGCDASPEELARDVHPDVRVDYLGPRQPKRPPAVSTDGRSGWRQPLRGWLEKTIVPDVSVISLRRLADHAERLTRDFAPDIVLSSSPPHSIHWLGRRLARAAGAKWVADFRDPYTIDVRFQPTGWRSPLWSLHRSFERSVYRDADMTVHAIPLHGRWARRAHPDRRGPAEVLENGPPAELAANPPRQVSAPGARRSLRSVGYLGDQAPGMLFDALDRLASEGTDIEFRHAGRTPETVAELPDRAAGRMVFLGPVPHPEAIRLVSEADLLVAFLSEHRSTYLGMSSKLYEFLATGAPVLAINPTRIDRMLLRRIPGCVCLTKPSVEQLTAALRSMAASTDASERESTRAAYLARYNRQEQTAQLAAWLERTLD